MIDGAAVGAFLRAYLEQVEAEQARLDGLDAVAGDGDHGATMVLGMRAVVAALPPHPGRRRTTSCARRRRRSRRSAGRSGRSGGRRSCAPPAPPRSRDT